MENIKTFVCRSYQSIDLESILSLFYDTVHAVNIKDYSQEQIDVWAPGVLNKEKWAYKLSKNITYVVELQNKIVGFGDMTQEGYLDHLYVDKDFQRCGIAALIFKAIKEKAYELGLTEITTESSITAKPFFEKQGFVVIKEQEKMLRGMFFITYIMKKILEKNI